MKADRQPSETTAKVERYSCSGQSYLITREMCIARAHNGFPKCAKCSRAPSAAKTA